MNIRYCTIYRGNNLCTSISEYDESLPAPIKQDDIVIYQEDPNNPYLQVGYFLPDIDNPKSAIPPCAPNLSQSDQYTAWMTILALGYNDITGIKLKTDLNSQLMFTSLIAWFREALELGGLQNDSLINIYDYNSKEYSMTVIDIRKLMVRYGQYIKAIYDRYAP